MDRTMSPDFGPVPQGSGVRHAVLNNLVVLMASRRRFLSVLEVGSWTGQSALVWREAISQHCEKKGFVMCIDKWESYASEYDLTLGGAYAEMDRMLHSGETFRLFKENIKSGDTSVPIRWWKGTLNDCWPVCSIGNGYDIVYLDGSHYYEDVVSDIEIAKRLLKPNGLLCGDDLELQGDNIDQAAARGTGKIDYTSVGSSGGNYHPGVTLAVWEAFGKVWSESGVWAVQRASEFTYPSF